MQFSEQQQEETSGQHLIVYHDRRALRVMAVVCVIFLAICAGILIGQITMGIRNLYSVIFLTGWIGFSFLTAVQTWQYLHLLASNEPALVANQEGILLIKYGLGRKNRVMLPWSKIEKIVVKYGAPGSRVLCIHQRNSLSDEQNSRGRRSTHIYMLSKEFLDRTIEELSQQLYETYGHQLGRYNIQFQHYSPN